MAVPLKEIVAYLDELLDNQGVPDYPGALNGLQFENRGVVHKIAAAVDFSSRVLDGVINAGADLLLVHHGMFWGAPTPITGTSRERMRRLIEKDIGVYSSHLPLDCHPVVGNNVLLAKQLGLEPTHSFASYKGTAIGVRGYCDIDGAELMRRVTEFSRDNGGAATMIGLDKEQIRSWAICTGAGASAETISEAFETGVELLIVGEGPHWTAVEASERGLAIVYAGHYATETLGVRAIAQSVADRFSLDWAWITAPTGL